MALINLTRSLDAQYLKMLIEQLSCIEGKLEKILIHQKEMNLDILNVRTRIDDKLKDELNTVERKYISFLEGKLVRLDDEAAKLKGEKQMEYQRMHMGFFNTTNKQ